MFLIIKKSSKLIMGLEAADATLAAMYASIKEVYKDLEVDIQFNEPDCMIISNLVEFVRRMDTISDNLDELDIESNELDLDLTDEDDIAIEQVIEDESDIYIEDESGDIEYDIDLDNSEIEYSYDEDETSVEDTIEMEVEETQEEPVKEVVPEEPAEEVVVRRATSPADRMMEELKLAQKNEGLPELEGNKLNTLAYKEYLLNYMKMGFAANILKKKAKDIKDSSEQLKVLGFCNQVEKRTDEYEKIFKEIGLTTSQVHTFRMEVLREVKKYSDDSIREICDYLNGLYKMSEELIVKIK